MSFKDKTEFKDDLKSRKKLHKANITKLEKKLMIQRNKGKKRKAKQKLLFCVLLLRYL